MQTSRETAKLLLNVARPLKMTRQSLLYLHFWGGLYISNLISNASKKGTIESCSIYESSFTLFYSMHANVNVYFQKKFRLVGDKEVNRLNCMIVVQVL